MTEEPIHPGVQRMILALSHPAQVRTQLLERLLREVGKHPVDRLVPSLVLWDRIGAHIEWLEAQGLSGNSEHEACCAAIMRDCPGYWPLPKAEQKKRAKWGAMSRQAGHPLGDCFDTPNGLCGVCAA